MEASPPLSAIVDAFRATLAARGVDRDVRLHETHISLVLLAGEFAWKFKKPVNFGFIDFSTLARRRYFCARELELNRRYAPELYLALEAIDLPGVSPSPCEYAVRMLRFDADATLDRLLADGRVDGTALAAFGTTLAQLHAAAPVPDDATLGSAALQRAQLEACVGAPLAAHLPTSLRSALDDALHAALPLLARRRAAGRVRDCHGDLHASNVVRLGTRLLPFDCIEFNDELRVIDTLSDAAFLLMDLDHHGAPRLGNAFLNAYLECADEHAGLAVLPLLLAYRSLVRAKVALLRAAQGGASAAAARARATAHVALAERYLVPDGRPGLVITHGVAGSGKTFHAARLATERGFVHLRSDIERRRVAGLALDARSDSTLGTGLYTPARSHATYARLRELADAVLRAGFSVVVDATFLDARDRAPFRALAQAHGAPFHVLACAAPPDELRRRVETRRAAGCDASEATVEVLEMQLRGATPLAAGERDCALDPSALEWNAATLAALGRARPH